MSEQRLGEQPSGLAPAKLGGAFTPAAGAPDRAARLRGLALGRSPAQAPAPAPESVVEDVPAEEEPPRSQEPPAEPPAAREPQPSRRGGGRPSRTSVPSGSGSAVVVYLPVAVRDRLRDYVDAHRRRGVTFTDVVLDALDAERDRLGQLVTCPGRQRSTGSMFAGRERLRRRHDDPQVQVTLRPVLGDLTIIDRLVAEHRAGSRSALIAAALDAFLPAPSC